MKTKRNQSKILTQKLEGISKTIFEKYKKEVIQYIGNKPGIYALYDEKELYYVGRAVDLASRVNRHLKDQHSALWTHFSLYLTKKIQYINDIEAVVIAIADPKGNENKPEIDKEIKLKKMLRKAIETRHQAELRELGFGRKKQVSTHKNNNQRPNLKNYFIKARSLMKIYKGKTYKATLLKSGEIKYKNKTYKTPTASAQAIVQKVSPNSNVNGWRFWFVKNNENKWVKLNELD